MVQRYSPQDSTGVCIEPAAEATSPLASREVPADISTLRILVDIRMTNGIHIRQQDLDYLGLRRLVDW